ncbi:MAG: 5-(carboxyamino)imidazole ribonucleotide synthase [Gammaproteobacteria bacterium]
MKIGVIGGGQLARMLALAGHSLGFETICLESQNDCPAAKVTEVIVADYGDAEKLRALVNRVDVLTYEFENIPTNTIEILTPLLADKPHKIAPSLEALSIAQDRYREKTFFQKLQIPTTTFASVDSLETLRQAAEHIQFPAILKTRRWGYDGKGQYVLKSAADIESAWEDCAGEGLLENKVNFEKEFSCIGVRSAKGEIAFYPLAENWHKEGILRTSTVQVSPLAMERDAQTYVANILEALNYVGVLAVEFFWANGQLIANEMAPRVHNSGHWTIEGAVTSQFENHLRAILGLPLGDTAARQPVTMFNLIGEVPRLETILQVPGAHCHLYGKQAKPKRKLGHVTLCAQDEVSYRQGVEKLLGLVL